MKERALLFVVLSALTSSSASAEYVRGYFRSDGTYVQPYERRPRGSSAVVPSGGGGVWSELANGVDTSGPDAGPVAADAAREIPRLLRAPDPGLDAGRVAADVGAKANEASIADSILGPCSASMLTAGLALGLWAALEHRRRKK